MLYSENMKKFSIIILAIFAAATVGVAPAYAVEAPYSNQSDFEVTSAASTAFEGFANEIVRDGATKDSLRQKADEAVTALEAVGEHTFSAQPGGPYREKAVVLKTKAEKLKSEVGKAADLFGAGDGAAFNAYLEKLQGSAQAYDDSVTALNEAAEKPNEDTINTYVWWLIAAGAVAMIVFVTVVLWAISRGSGKNKSRHSGKASA